MCDAVLDLDNDLNLKDHFPKFANMLMHGAGRFLRGSAFSTFIRDDEDRAAMEETLRRGLDAGPGMVTTHLRDSMGNFVKVVVFHVPYLSLSGCTNYLIGLREDSDAWAGAGLGGCVCAQAFIGLGSMPEAVLRPDVVRELGVHSEAQTESFGRCIRYSDGTGAGSIRSSKSSHSHNTAACFGEWEVPDAEMAVRIAIAPGLPVARMGQGLCERLRVGEGEQCALADFLPDQGRGLISWLQEAVNVASLHGREDRFILKFGELELISRRPGAAGPVRGMAFVRFPWPLQAPEDVAIEVVLGLSRGQRGVTDGRGTAPVFVPQALPSGSSQRPICAL